MIRSLLLGAALLPALIIGIAPPTETDEGGPVGSAALSTGGTALDVSGERSTSESAAPSDSSDSSGSSQDTAPAPPPPPTNIPVRPCMGGWAGDVACIVDEDSAPAYEPVTIQVTITDLAQFAPPAAVLAVEPAGVGVAGRATNFVAAASVHTQSGTLFGYPIQARFTPAGFDYSFGDGDSATFLDSGQSWDALRLPQFTPTPTSHVYSARGTYPVNLTVRYTAEVNLGAGWLPVAGELRIPTPEYSLRIYEARSMLVHGTCLQNPGGTGC